MPIVVAFLLMANAVKMATAAAPDTQPQLPGTPTFHEVIVIIGVFAVVLAVGFAAGASPADVLDAFVWSLI